MTEKLQEEILAMSEVSTYFTIDECGAFIWSMGHNISHGRIPDSSIDGVRKDMQDMSEIQQFAVSTLTRFGVDPKSAEDRANGEYWKWFRFWDNWKNTLTIDEWETISDLISKDKPLDDFLPSKKWND